jgi:hypothetical protein
VTARGPDPPSTSDAPRSGALRVLVGTHEIVRQVHDLAEGFRARGHAVTTVVDAPNPFYRELDYDTVRRRGWLRPRGGSVPERVLNKATAAIAGAAAAARVRRLIDEHDVFVFVWGGSLLPANVDLPLLRRSHKTVLSVFLGSDIRHWSATDVARAQQGIGTYAGYRDGPTLDGPLRTLRMAELYGDANFFQPSYGELALAPYMHCYLAVDLAAYDHRIHDREVPVVVHAPSRRAVKGTEAILEALERLRREGVAFELRLLEAMPNDEVRRALADADVVIDELNESHYGMLALEAMASGCTVLGGNRPDIVPLPRERPVVHITPSTLESELRRVLTDREWRLARAHSGRSFVERHHDRAAVAGNMLAAVGRVAEGDADYQPSFFVDEYELPDGCTVSRRNRRLTRRVVDRLALGGEVMASLVRRGLA